MILSHPDFSVSPAFLSPKADSLFFHMENGRILLCSSDEGSILPTFAQIHPLLAGNADVFELAHEGERGIFSLHPFRAGKIEESESLKYFELNIFRSLCAQEAARITACVHLWNWYQSNRFCGRCGHALSPDAKERALRCPECGKLLFPTIAPAVIVAITCADRILLARNARSTFTHYALIAGYVEVGETLEHAVRREVMEEVGLKLDTLQYLGDQPWGVSGSHMFAFHATADDHQEICLQKEELTDARWFGRSELSPTPNTISVAFELIERFRLGTL